MKRNIVKVSALVLTGAIVCAGLSQSASAYGYGTGYDSMSWSGNKCTAKTKSLTNYSPSVLVWETDVNQKILGTAISESTKFNTSVSASVSKKYVTIGHAKHYVRDKKNNVYDAVTYHAAKGVTYKK